MFNYFGKAGSLVGVLSAWCGSVVSVMYVTFIVL